MERLDAGSQGLDVRTQRGAGLRRPELVEALLDAAEPLVQPEDGRFEVSHARSEALHLTLCAREPFLDRGDLVLEREQAMKDGVGLSGYLVGERIDTGVEQVEAPIGGIEPAGRHVELRGDGHEPLVMAIQSCIDGVEPCIDRVEPCVDRVEP